MRRERNQSILDSVNDKIKSVRNTISSPDRARLDSFTENVREIERRLTIAASATTGQASQPTAPTMFNAMAVNPRNGELIASIDAPLVAPPSAPAIDITIRPSVNAPARTSPPPRPSFDRTVTSEAPPEAVLAAQAAGKASVPLRHSGTLRSAIDPAVLAASQKRRRIRAMLTPWTEARIVVAFVLGLSCGTFLGVLLARMVAR